MASSDETITGAKVVKERLVSLLGQVVADVSAVSTVSETPLMQFTLPAALPAGSILKLRAAGDYLNDTGVSATTTCTLKLGTSTLLTVAPSQGTNALRRRWTLDVLIYVTAAGQVADGRLDFTQGASSTWVLNSLAYQGRGSVAEDLSAGKVLSFTVQHGTSSPSLEMRIQEASLILVPKA